MKIIRSYLLIAAIVILIFVISRPTPAQYTDSMGYSGWNNPMSSLASTMLWSRLIYRTPADYKNGTISSGKPTTGTSARTSTQSQAQPSKPANTNIVKFHSSGAYIRTRDLADQLGNTAAQREEYLRLMNTVLDGFGQQAQKAGLQNDLALALSYFLGENLRVYRGVPDLSDQQFIDLRNTIAEVLASTGALNTATDRQKQEFYEALVAYTGITQYGYEQSLKAGNREMAQGYQKVAGQNLQTVTKLSPDRISLGADGTSVNGNSADQINERWPTGRVQTLLRGKFMYWNKE